tara:strand:+ start:34 stop:624 length:591 start_codon:yes stop_codon:yes gene_type:complete
MKVIIASGNSGKILELEKTLAPLAWNLLPLSNYHPPIIEEVGSTFDENAIIKARAASKHTGLPAIADDSGLEVDYLCGRPGVRSARFSDTGTDYDNNVKLVNELSGVSDEFRAARFHCSLVFLSHYDESAPLVCRAKWEGRILQRPSGQNGFGYDPLFFVNSHNCSAAELKPEIKNLISHRGQASALLLSELKKLF